MAEENMNHEFRLKKVDEVKHTLIEEMNQNYLMSRKHKKVSRVLNLRFISCLLQFPQLLGEFPFSVSLL